MTSDGDRSAAFGGPGWRPRTTPLQAELGSVWGACGQRTEWERLDRVLLHRPGAELDSVPDPESALMLDFPDARRAAAQHDALADAYRAAGVGVEYVEPPPGAATPNLMFTADLFFMTSEGAILARPAGAARAGEERWVQRRLADLGVPIVRAVGGVGTFEGADAMWLEPTTVLLGAGFRTNAAGAGQVAGVLGEMGVDLIVVDLPPGAMHLMGQLRIVDMDLALYRDQAFPGVALAALSERGFRAMPFPGPDDERRRFAHNFVTIGPREILMSADCPVSRKAYEGEGIRCHEVDVDEITKAAGGIGCVSGVLARSTATASVPE